MHDYSASILRYYSRSDVVEIRPKFIDGEFDYRVVNQLKNQDQNSVLIISESLYFNYKDLFFDKSKILISEKSYIVFYRSIFWDSSLVIV